MVARLPTPKLFNVLVDGQKHVVQGWESSAALGVALVAPGEYASIMLLTGALMARGFESVEEAHEFNLLAGLDKMLHPGAVSLAEFYDRAGGPKAAAERVEKCKQKILALRVP